MERPAGWAGGGAAVRLGGGGAAGSLEPSLSIGNDFFLINSKCRFSHQLCLWPTGGCCLCVWLFRRLVVVTMEIPEEMVAVACVCQPSGDGFSPVSACMCVCSQPLTSREGCDCTLCKMEVLRRPGASERQLAQMPGCAHAPDLASGSGSN